MLEQTKEESEQVSTSTNSTDEGVFIEEDTCHRPVEILKPRDRNKSETSQEFRISSFNSTTGSEDLEFSEEANRKFAKLSGAYEELCRKTITLVHSQSDIRMFNNSDGPDEVFQSCDTVLDLTSKYSTNNLLPQREDDEASKQRNSSDFRKNRTARDSVSSTSLKPSSNKNICGLISKMVLETLLSYVRNIGCFVFIICFLTIVVLHPQPYLMVRADYEIDVILLLIGSLIFSWQICNVIKQSFKFKVSTIQDILIHNLADAEEFEDIVRQKRSTPPYLTLELKVKKLSTLACFLFGCCTCCKRGMDNLLPKRHCTVLNFDNWFDSSHVKYRKKRRKSSSEGRSQNSVFQGSPPSTPHMVIISKDCKLVDQTTSSSIDQEVNTIKSLFADDLELDESHVVSEINVDVQEGLRFPDVEAFLILNTQTLEKVRANAKSFFARHSFFSSKTLLIFSLLGIDSLYYTIFLFRCISPTRYSVVKYVKRNVLSRVAEESGELSI